MTPARKGELVLLLLKYQMRQRGIHLNSHFKEGLKEVAEDIGASYEEVVEVTELLTREVVDEAFKAPFKRG